MGRTPHSGNGDVGPPVELGVSELLTLRTVWRMGTDNNPAVFKGATVTWAVSTLGGESAQWLKRGRVRRPKARPPRSNSNANKKDLAA